MAEGRLILVVGPSGVGKDTVISLAAERLAAEPRLSFAQRIITRPRKAGGEVHAAVEPDVFAQMVQHDKFAVHWHAHGLRYGVPAETFEEVSAGKVVVVNGSRGALPAFRAAYPRLTVVSLTATPQALAARLRARKRESEAEIEERLKRAFAHDVSGPDVVEIDNSGPVEAAVDHLVATIKAALGAEDAPAG